ncbi:hypothetical protein FHL15_006038 [Xylaria flabelliformis]|uniref:Uncharacterized protein n=1 Tax=Xylaria flabelliformis TaxID=2512241 RepID=A0A553HZ00_9PEZI|nr:hypothetical protein FHL15_006038 [Xylaria flabelliformis]
MLTLILLFLSVFGHVFGLPTTDKDFVAKDTNAIHESHNATILPRVLPIYGNPWQYDREECIWVRQFNPVVATTCTEYCMAGLTGYRSRLRYHIMMTGNGQDLDGWCENFKRRLMFKCNVDEPDFFNCNTGVAPLLTELETYVYDTWKGRVVTTQGINLRFDFHRSWPADAYHQCVAETIGEVTCRGANQRLGLRCLPVLWKAPPDQDDEDVTPIPPQGCLKDDQVPPSST